MLGAPQRRPPPSAVLTPNAFELGLQMVKVVLFLVIIVLLAIWMVASVVTARQSSDLKASIREALEAMKSVK